ncbi:hypothetical protein D3C80_1893160 [compost metagenome]
MQMIQRTFRIGCLPAEALCCQQQHRIIHHQHIAPPDVILFPQGDAVSVLFTDCGQPVCLSQETFFKCPE